MSEINPLSSNTPIQQPNIKVDEPKVSPFQQFLGPTASKEQVTTFINQWVKDLVADMRKADAKWKESMRKMREGE